MPIATNLIVTTKNGNKTKTTNITYANPEAADSSLATFAASVFSLSQNELVSIERVNKSALDLPAPAGKSSPQLSAEDVYIGTNYSESVTVSRLGNGAISVSSYSGNAEVNGTTITFNRPGIDDFSETVIISVAETDDYAAESITIAVSGRHSTEQPIPVDMPEP